MNQDIIFEAHNICKYFGTVTALDHVDFVLRSGEVHGLIGENGSGKSTLSSIIAGVQKSDEGEMLFHDRQYCPSTALEANKKGIDMLLQERGTFGGISVSANIFIGKEERFIKNGLLSISQQNKAGRKALDAIGAKEINEKAMTDTLSFEQQKIVEIARAAEGDPEILIVDETTTALSRGGRELLYAIIKKMKSHNKSIIFISHDIEEVKEICDSLTVLRDGHKIETLDKKDFSDARIRQLMVGRDIGENFYRSDQSASCRNEIALSVKHVSYGILKDINFELHQGEILGVGGLTDCGMHDLGKVLFGFYPPEAGDVMLHNGQIVKNTHIAVKNKIAYVAKDRDREALMVTSSIEDNICAPSLKKLEKHGIITKKSEKNFARKWAEDLNVKMSGIDQLVLQLSGGNKQKVSVAKWIGYDADIFIFDCPTRGIDIGVKAAIYQLLMAMKAQGKAVVMISEELPEIIGMSDRVIILKNGCMTGTFSRNDQLTESKLIEYII